MLITKIHNYNINKPVNPKQAENNSQIISQNAELPRHCANQIYFCAGFPTNSDIISKNLKAIAQEFNTTFSPSKYNIAKNINEETLDFFNRIYNCDCKEISIPQKENPSLIINGLKYNNSDFILELTKKEHNGENFLQIDYSSGENDIKNTILINKFKVLQKDGSQNITAKNLSKIPNADFFDENTDKICKLLNNLNDFINLHITQNPNKYFLYTFNNCLELMNKISTRLNELEYHKMFALKRSYPGYMQFPRKSTFYLKDTDKFFSPGYAIIKHREKDSDYMRLLEINSQNTVENAFLVDAQKGVLKNYCPGKLYKWSNLAHTPANLSTMTDEELLDTKALKIVAKYYDLLSDFENHINKNITHTTKHLEETNENNQAIGYNTINSTFTSKIPLILSKKDSVYTLNAKDGSKYTLYYSNEEGSEILNLACEKKGLRYLVKLNPLNSKIIMTNSEDKILKNNNGEVRYVPSTGNLFKTKSKIMKAFIQEALQAKEAPLSEHLSSNLKNFAETYANASATRANMSITKKTAFMKTFTPYTEARGNTGEIRFNIPNKDYAIGLKPQHANSTEFMRLSVYDNEGKLQKAYLIKDFYKFVDNYCQNGYTKDAISRIPKAVVYKTEKQLEDEKIPELMREYLEILQDFQKAAEEFSQDRRKNK